MESLGDVSLVLVVGAPVVNCYGGATALRLRQAPAGPVEARLDWWCERMSKRVRAVSARAGFGGEAWSLALDAAADSGAALYVASPAQGLIGVDSGLADAEASFSPESADSVGGESDAQRWWHGLHEREDVGRVSGGLPGLVRRHPGTTVLVALSGDAVRALHGDLWEARELMSNRDRFLVLSSPAAGELGLGASHVRIDMRFEALVGGARADVPVRVLHYLAKHYDAEGLQAPFVQRWLRERSWGLPPVAKPKRRERRLPGRAELERFVMREVGADPLMGVAALRRRLHAAGLTCATADLEEMHKRHARPLLVV